MSGQEHVPEAAGRKSPPDRYRFAVPKADEEVIAWLGAQENMSVSIRYIIKQYIKEHGITDAFCTTVPQAPAEPQPAKRGRPPKNRQPQAAAQMAQTATVQAQAAPQVPPLQQPMQPAPLAQAAARPKQQPVPQTKAPGTDADGFVDPDSFFN